MRKAKIEQIKNIFLQKKAEILVQQNQKLELDVSGDEVDIVQGEMLGAMVEKLGQRNLLLLKKIESALLRIDDGSFGECEECGEFIGDKRLVACPEATTCIKCAERLEKLAKGFAH